MERCCGFSTQTCRAASPKEAAQQEAETAEGRSGLAHHAVTDAEQALVDGQVYELGLGADLQLAFQQGHMVRDGLAADAQPLGDLRITYAQREPDEDFTLKRCPFAKSPLTR